MRWIGSGTAREPMQMLRRTRVLDQRAFGAESLSCLARRAPNMRGGSRLAERILTVTEKMKKLIWDCPA
ncbi:hypothetical protein ABIE78_002792 [Sinorhizobium fredii]